MLSCAKRCGVLLYGDPAASCVVAMATCSRAHPTPPPPSWPFRQCYQLASHNGTFQGRVTQQHLSDACFERSGLPAQQQLSALPLQQEPGVKYYSNCSEDREEVTWQEVGVWQIYRKVDWLPYCCLGTHRLAGFVLSR
jgi:hypothetical protein